LDFFAFLPALIAITYFYLPAIEAGNGSVGRKNYYKIPVDEWFRNINRIFMMQT